MIPSVYVKPVHKGNGASSGTDVVTIWCIVDEELTLSELGIDGGVDRSIKERLGGKLAVAESPSSGEIGIVVGFGLRRRGGRDEVQKSEEEKVNKELHDDCLRRLARSHNYLVK